MRGLGRRRSWVAAIVILAASAALAVGWQRQRRPAGPRPINVLLITIDTLRADALGSYGKPDAGTPWLDRLAAGGVRFTQAHAHNVVTLPSHANILSGLLPTRHGVHDNAGFRFPGEVATLATLLRAKGYQTGAFVSAFPLAGRFGLDRGFDMYDDSFLDAQPPPGLGEHERPGTETVTRVRRWLGSADPGRPSLAWIHLYEPHFPYAPPEPLASRYGATPYQGDVAAADAALGPIIDDVLSEQDGRTLVVVTSDHGESLGEHGEATHGILAYEATLRVPLIVFAPAVLGPRVTGVEARHVDVLPTILDVLGIPIPAGLDGRSLLPAARGELLAGAPTYFEALSGTIHRGWAPLRGFLSGSEKYIDLPIPELYDLAKDPAEAHNLAAGRSQERHRAVLTEWTRGADPVVPRPENDEVRGRLAALGYVASGTAPTATSYTAADDPKNLMALDAKLQEVASLDGAGRLPEAIAACHDLIARRPAMALSHQYLAHLERRAGNLPAAARALGTALRLNPGDTATAAVLGSVLTQIGRASEAVAILSPLAQQEPADEDVLLARALSFAKLGKFSNALDDLRRASGDRPPSAKLLIHRGTVRLMADDETAARLDFEQALARNPDAARAHSSLALLLARAGRGSDALDHWRAAVKADPREHRTLLESAAILSRSGRYDEARRALELFAVSAPPSGYAPDLERVHALLGSPASTPPAR